MNNQVAILKQPKNFVIEEEPIPEPKEHEILMEVEYTGMCGSDIHGFEFGPYKQPKPGQKVELGHEVSGHVVKVGSAVTKFKVGDKVLIEPGVPDDTCEYCRTGHYNVCPDVDFLGTAPSFKGAFKTYMTHPETWTYHVPEGMSTLEAALVEPAAVGMHAAILGGAKLGSHIVILGCGCIGLMTLQACLSLGATDITMVDMIQKKLDFAKKLGARQVINTRDIKLSNGDRCTPDDIAAYLRSDEQFGAHGVPLVFECSGSGFLGQVAVGIVAYAGKVMMVGTQAKPLPVDFGKINREVTIMTTFRYCNNFPQTIEAIASGKFNVKDMVTNIYDFKDIQQAFEDSIDPVKKEDWIKGVIRIGGTEY